MNLGDNIILKDIALFSRSDAEEAAMVLRYFYTKEQSWEKKKIYQNYLARLEDYLVLTYNREHGLNLPA